MKINSKQIAAVQKLSGPERYKHFIKVVADWEEVWGLYKDGWALAQVDNGQVAFPMWPAKEYAENCAQNMWDGFLPRSFTVEELLSELLPNLQNDNVLPCVFYTPEDKGIIASVAQLTQDLENELQNY